MGEEEQNNGGNTENPENKKPVGRPRKPVIYWAVNANLTIGANQLKRERRNAVSGVVEEHSGLIGFHDNHYKTDDPAEIALIEATKSFKIGKVERVTEDQFLRLLEGAGRPGMVKEAETSPAGRI